MTDGQRKDDGCFMIVIALMVFPLLFLEFQCAEKQRKEKIEVAIKAQQEEALWEKLPNNTARKKVPSGGWFYRVDGNVYFVPENK